MVCGIHHGGLDSGSFRYTPARQVFHLCRRFLSFPIALQSLDSAALRGPFFSCVVQDCALPGCVPFDGLGQMIFIVMRGAFPTRIRENMHVPKPDIGIDSVVSINSASVSPGNPTIRSVVRFTFGMAARAAATSALYSSTLHRRAMRRNTLSLPLEREVEMRTESRRLAP